uniref:Uncharacterized protein n=1 Tax=Acrobeloides nanus TaxID=290746 RepID=A0A914CK50_9BILA
MRAFCDDYGSCNSGYECVQNLFEKSVFPPSNRGLCLKFGCSDQRPTPILPRNSRVKRGFLQSLQDFWAGMALWG